LNKYVRRTAASRAAAIIVSMLALWGALATIPAVPARADTAPGYPGLGFTPQIDIRDVVNVQGPDNTQAVFSVTQKPLLVKSNAVDVAVVDFVDKDTKLNQASIFAAVTVDVPYPHTYQTCNRASGFSLDEAYTVGVPDLVSGIQTIPQFWYTSMSKRGVVEKAFTFIVYVNEAKKTFTVDSVWWPEGLSASQIPNHSYIFSFEIFSVSHQDSQNILINILDKFSSYDGWQIKYNNTNSIKPTVLIKNVTITQVRVQNLLPQAQQVHITGYVRYPEHKDTLIPFKFDKMLDTGLNIIEIPITKILDEDIYIQSEDFKWEDEAYVGNGYWMAFSNKKTITMTENQQISDSAIAEGDFNIGSAGITGNIPNNGFGGMARTLNPNSLPVDISGYKYLSFKARGDGKPYSVQLETEAVRDLNSSDFAQYIITTSPDWQQYVIPLSSFKQIGKDPSKVVPYTGTDVISVAWKTTSAPLDSVNLEVKDATFIGNTSIIITIGSNKMLINGAVKDLDPGYQTVPVIIEGRVFLPISSIIEALGGIVNWNAADQTLTIELNNTKILLAIGKTSAIVNGVDKELEDAPFISAMGRTMLPLRFVAENLGRTFSWDGTSKTITIE
jgi:hypothetical protein